MEIRIDNISNINQAAREFVAAMNGRKIFAFYGKMGSGKTTLIKAICENLGVKDPITSPTFAIVNEYTSELNDIQTIFHFDLYRINKIDELYDLGFEDYIYSNAICFIEWPELGEDLLPDSAVKVAIDILNDGSRIVSID